MGFRGNNRAVSIAVTHALTVAISTVLVSGLIIGAGTLLESQEQRISEDQVEEIGSDAVSYITTFDRMNTTGENVTMTAAPDYPARIVGSYQYELVLSERAGPSKIEVIVRVDGLDRSATFPVDLQNTEIDTPSGEDSVSTTGSDAEMSLCTDGTITFGGCSV
jgi:hypothetical protein